MRAAAFVACLLLAVPAHATCPASRPEDPCRLTWSEKYGTCMVAHEDACADVAEQNDEERKRDQEENLRVFEAAMEVARIQGLPGKVANAFGQSAPKLDARGRDGR